ncbi:MAG: hypothetical protein LLG01_00820 [Planctomycetaceae bacterium]|nr:hypothetical protein [Planctomycetaceae bacterium]
MTDGDCEQRQIKPENAVRQNFIESHFGRSRQVRLAPFRNGFPVPLKMAQAIQQGKCRKIMLADGRYAECHIDGSGHLHNEHGPALVCTAEHSKRCWPQKINDGQRMALWYEHGVGGKMEVLD